MKKFTVPFLFLSLLLCVPAALAQDSTQQRVVGVNAEPAPGACAANKLYKLIVAPYTLWKGGAAGTCVVVGATVTLPATATQGDVLYGSASNTYSNLAKSTSATRYLSNTGTSNNPAWAQVALATGVSGVLPAANNTVAVLDDSVAYCADAGASDTYACALSPVPAAYVTGARYRFKANTANTGAATLNLNGLGAKTIKKVAGGITTDLADNDIRVGQIVELSYDGTNLQIQSTLGNAGGGGGLSGLATGQYLVATGATTASTDGVKRYVALLTQSGTDAPVATVLENTLGGTVVWTRDGAGSYTGTLAGAFPADKVITLAGTLLVNNDWSIARFRRGDANTVGLTTVDTGASADDLLSETPVIIYVYP